MKICVIGGSGFIGSQLIKLLELNDFIIFDKSPPKNNSKFLQIDIRDLDDLVENLKGFDLVIHLAAEHADNVIPKSLYYDVSVEGTRNVLKAMQINGIKKLIFTSTVAVYGLNKKYPDENHKIEPFNDVIRSDKTYIYPHMSSTWLRSCINRPFILFPVSTDKDFTFNRKFRNIVGPCSGLQILRYIHKELKNLYLYDLHLDAISFTKDIIWNWDWRTQSLSNLLRKYDKPETYIYESEKNVDDYCLEIVEQNSEFFETLSKIRTGEIFVEISQKDMLDVNTYPHALSDQNTLIQFSNVLSYSPTFYSLSAIDADLIFLNVLKEMSDDSVFVGMVPFRGWREFTKKDIIINDKLNLPWRQDLYEGYYKSRVRALQ